MISDWIWIAWGTLGVVAASRGVHMVSRPMRYLGPRWHEASDPRTVRFFGGLHLVLAAFLVIAVIVKIARG